MSDSVFQAIEQKRVSSRIIDQFKVLISSGKLKPGDPLPPERTLMKTFGVSRPTLREALNALSTMGFISMEQRRRTTVRSLVPSNITEPICRLLKEDMTTSLELIESRSVIEVASARFAARRANEADITRLERCLVNMRDNITQERTFSAVDAEFHLTVAEASHNKIQAHLMFSIYDLLKERVFMCYAPGGDQAEAVFAQHQAIVAAIKSRDEQLAAEKMEEHLSYVESLVKRFIEKN